MADTLTTTAPTTNDAAVADAAPKSDVSIADALYGGKATEGQEQQVADATKAVEPDATKVDAPQGAPEKYEFKASEGKAFDAEVLTAFADVAKELNLTQDAAQKVLDRMAPKMEARQAQQIETLRTQWADSSKVDKEFGGEKLSENLSTAKKALDQFGTPELRSLLNESGLGNHPEFIRFMFRAGKSISEDRYVGQANGAAPTRGQPRDFASQAAFLYPKQS
jgi:hypothetical protein